METKEIVILVKCKAKELKKVLSSMIAIEEPSTYKKCLVKNY